MRKDSKTIIPYEDIDYELQNLIRLINTIEGIETTECCCGHGTSQCQIWFKADNTEYLTKFWHKYLYDNPNWHIVLNMTDTDINDGEWNTPTYLLETTFSDLYYTGLAIDNLAYRIEIGKLKGENMSSLEDKIKRAAMGEPYTGNGIDTMMKNTSSIKDKVEKAAMGEPYTGDDLHLVIDTMVTSGAISKVDYEVRLKADMIAMLEELRKSIADNAYSISSYNNIKCLNHHVIDYKDVKKIITEKINKLKKDKK